MQITLVRVHVVMQYLRRIVVSVSEFINLIGNFIYLACSFQFQLFTVVALLFWFWLLRNMLPVVSVPRTMCMLRKSTLTLVSAVEFIVWVGLGSSICGLPRSVNLKVCNLLSACCFSFNHVLISSTCMSYI